MNEAIFSSSSTTSMRTFSFIMKDRLKGYNVESAALATKKWGKPEMDAGTVFYLGRTNKPPALASSGAEGFEPVEQDQPTVLLSSTTT